MFKTRRATDAPFSRKAALKRRAKETRKWHIAGDSGSGSVHQCPGMAYTRSFLSAIENMLQHAATRSNPAHKTGFVITYGADVAEFKASDAGGGGAAMLECAALVAVADLAAAHGRPVLLERANWGQY